MGCQLSDQQVTNDYRWRNLFYCPSSLIRGFPRLAIALWIRNNFVSLQSTKCSAMLLTRKRSSQAGVTTPILHIEDSPLPYVSSIKYLGILITPDLCWSQHIISNIHLRARQLIGSYVLLKILQECTTSHSTTAVHSPPPGVLHCSLGSLPHQGHRTSYSKRSRNLG